MWRRLLPLYLFAILTAIAAPAAADQVILTNGDRVTGTVASLGGATLTVGTPHGQLRIPWTDVAGLVVDDPILVTIGTAEPAEVRIAAGDASGRVMLNPGGPVELAQILTLTRPVPPMAVDGGANAGFITSGGNTEMNTLRVDADVMVRQRANRYTVAAAINRAKDRGAETARNWNAGFNYDRFLTERLFVNGNAIFTNDRFRDLDLRTALGAGLGYQVVNTTVARLTANAGLGWVNENFEAGVDDSYAAARESVALDIFIVPDRIQFFHQHDGYFGVTGEDNLFVRMKNGVRLGLVGALVTTAQMDFDYDRSPAPGRRNTDRTFALTFGYRF
jgi:putative salt-induced outer membrane protein YdiY